MLEESRICYDRFKKIYTHENECIEFNHKRLHSLKKERQMTFNEIFF